MELIPKRMNPKHRLMIFLVAVVIFLANNLTAFLIVESLNEVYTLIASTDAKVTSSLFTYISSSLSFRSDAWTMETREYLTFALSNILFMCNICQIRYCLGLVFLCYGIMVIF